MGCLFMASLSCVRISSVRGPYVYAFLYGAGGEVAQDVWAGVDRFTKQWYRELSAYLMQV